MLAQWLGRWLGGVAPLEAVAVVTGLIYLVLAVRQDRRCWIAGFLSTACYAVLCYRAALYMQAALQVYYLAMSVYGWMAWTGRGRHGNGRITRWPLRWHAAGALAVLALALSTSRLLAQADSPAPFLDALTTWASVFTTWLVARKVLENWLWWLCIDPLIAVLFWHSGHAASAGLYVVYLALVLVGWRAWWRDWHTERLAGWGT